MRVFFSVGEPSGDLHGANLIRELRRRQPTIECVGYGGPRMAEAGAVLLDDLTQLAVMWFLRALLNLHRFLWLYIKAKRYFRRHRPDAVVLIDYPGFNWWVARAAKRYAIPVFYYGAPQMWAWAPWRAHKMQRLVRHVLCKLPFEEAWFRSRGCSATYVGHPYFDEMKRQAWDESFLERQRRDDRPLITILPGSRNQEVSGNLAQFYRAAERVRGEHPHVRFAVAAFNESQAEHARRASEQLGMEVEVHVGRTAELIHLSRCCMACSGSVSLELLYHEKPSVILYTISPVAFAVQRLFRCVKYITLVNLFASSDPFPADLSTFDPDVADAERVPFPEYLTYRDVSDRVACHLLKWLRDDGEMRWRCEQLRQLKDRYAHPGASQRAARFLLDQLPARRHARRAHPRAA